MQQCIIRVRDAHVNYVYKTFTYVCTYVCMTIIYVVERYLPSPFLAMS